MFIGTAPICIARGLELALKSFWNSEHTTISYIEVKSEYELRCVASELG